MPDLGADEAFSAIYVLQEHLHLIPDWIEPCLTCHSLIDIQREGYYKEDVGHYCDQCSGDVD